MIRLNFLKDREFFCIVIDNKQIFYSDRKYTGRIRCVPKDEAFIKTIVCSRNKYPHFLIDLFNLNEKEQKEYDSAKTDEELAEFVKRDCLSIGARWVNES